MMAFVAFIPILSLTSCMGSYQFCQVYETKPVKPNEIQKTENGDLKYENSHCIITYNFWANYGTTNFEIYNKTNEILYVDLAKSFFIRNGIAYDIYKGREWSESESNTSGYSNGYGFSNTRSASLAGRLVPTTYGLGGGYTSTSRGRSLSYSYSSGTTHISSHSITVSTKEPQIIAIPPHTRKTITMYSIVNSPLLTCDLQQYPEHDSRMSFTSNDSPIVFANYITYAVGEDSNPIAIENSFYVSAITNYAEPDIIEYKKRSEPCENLKDNPEYATHNRRGRLLYDKTMKSNICEFPSSFYLMYETTSSKRLYKVSFLTTYWYDPEFHAYTVGSNGNY